MTTVQPKFFNTIKWPEGKHEFENFHFLGKMSEWFFDFGQKSYSVEPKKHDHYNTVLIENSKISKSAVEKIIQVIGYIFKAILCATIVPALLFLIVKSIYRQQNNFSVDASVKYVPPKNKSDEFKDEQKELREAEIIGGIYSEDELNKYYLILDHKIDEFRIENVNDLSDLTDLYRDLHLHNSLIKNFITPNLQKKYSDASFLPLVVKKSEDLIIKLNGKIAEQFLNKGSEIREFFNQFEIVLKNNIKEPDFLTRFDDHISIYLRAIEFLSKLSSENFYDKNLKEDLTRLTLPKGIKNIGNSCYMNSALQSLIAVPYFRNFLSQNKDFKKILDDYENSNKTIDRSNARAFRNSIFEKSFLEGEEGAQNDPAELMTALLGDVNYSIETLDYPIKDKDNEERIIKSKVSLLGISLKENREKGLHSHSFQNLIDREFSEHKIGNDEGRMTKLTNAPEYLIIQLFRFGNEDNKLVKYDDELIFNQGENIDFKDAIFNQNPEESYLYEPCAVLYHHGNEMKSGHYTADVKRGGTWYHCNDESVTHKGLNNMDIGKAYIYVFKKKSTVKIDEI